MHSKTGQIRNVRKQLNITYALIAGVDLNTVAARKTCECMRGPQYTDSEKDLRTKKRTCTVRNSAPTKNPSPAPSSPDLVLRSHCCCATPQLRQHKGLCQQGGGEDGTTRELQVEWKCLTFAPARRNTNSLSPNQQTRRMTRTFFHECPIATRHSVQGLGAPKFTLLRLAQSQPSPPPSYV